MGGIGGQIPNFPGPVKIGTAPNQLTVSEGGIITMAGTSKRILTLRPEIDYVIQIAQAKPTQVLVGVFAGFSFPIYNTDNEELFFKQTIPGRWDGASDITYHMKVALANAEDVGDKFKFQLSWEHAFTDTEIPATSNDVTTEVTILTDRNAQYDEYDVAFTIDYNIDGAGNKIEHHCLLAGRLRRIAASGNEVDNEIICFDHHIHYNIDKAGAAPL